MGKTPTGRTRYKKGGNSKTRQRYAWAEKKRREAEEANMSAEEREYRERLLNLTREIDTIKRQAVFDGQSELLSKLNALHAHAQEMIRDVPTEQNGAATDDGMPEAAPPLAKRAFDLAADDAATEPPASE